MPSFLTDDQCYRIIQRELPQKAYPDGPKGRYFSTAESYAGAAIVRDLYANMGRVYANVFPQSADELIVGWETSLFGGPQSATPGLAARQAALLAKIRDRTGCSTWDLLMSVIIPLLPPGTPVRIVKWSSILSKGWPLGSGRLGIDTYLAGYSQPILSNVNQYVTNAATQPPGWARAQVQAYSYEVRIYGYTMSGGLRASMDLILSKREFAREQHFLRDGCSLALENLLTAVADVDRFVNVTYNPAIYTDSGSSTGYSGWRDDGGN